jgi:hypothetical protein
MTWLRWKRAPWQTDEDYLTWYGLTEAELNQLSRYNSERGRGIAHTEEWVARMTELQRRFDGAEGRPPR